MINQIKWEEILKEAQKRGVPPLKKRAVLREYLQTLFLTSFYRLPGCARMAFIGGTSLRLLRGLDRFSEDLDFDNFGLSQAEVKKLFAQSARIYRQAQIKYEFNFKKTQTGGRGRLRFPDLLFDLKMSTNPKEKLKIRLDFTSQKRFETEVIFLALFGFSERVVTNTLPVLLSQKARALFSRKQTRGRDFYDLYWLLSRGVKPNLAVLKPLKIKNEAEFFSKLKKFYEKEKKNLNFYKKQIRPFLIEEKNQRYLDLFGDLVG